MNTETQIERPFTYRIPDPPAGMFTDAEWAEILKGRAERIADGTSEVGD